MGPSKPSGCSFLGGLFFLQCMHWTIGDDSQTHFWEDCWVGRNRCVILQLSCKFLPPPPPPNKVPFGGLVVLSLILLPCFALTFGALYFGFSPFHETSKCAYEEGMFIHGLLIILERSCANFFSLFWLHILLSCLYFLLSGKLKF